jgi:phosphohistidine phosphatase
MRLYLVQHGEAVPKEIDPDRPLSPQGENDIKRIAGFLKASGIPVKRILHSGKTRARQTADIMKHDLLKNAPVETIDGIAPNDPVETFAMKVPTLGTEVMIVGHLPFMAKLMAWLVTADETRSLVAYQPGSVVCLEQDASRNWQILWMIRPDCVPAT